MRAKETMYVSDAEHRNASAESSKRKGAIHTMMKIF